MWGKTDVEICKQAWGYAKDVVSGKIVVCDNVKLSCQHALDMKKRKDITFDENAAARPIRFANFLNHLKGPKAGEPIELESWQMFLVSQIYGWMRPDGLRLRRSVYIEVPRKSGKSTLCSVLSLYHLIADSESSAEIYSAATSRDQARIVFGDAQAMVRASKHLSQHLTVHRSSISHQATNSKFEPLSADAGSLEGRNPSFSVVDELHIHKTPDVYDVLNIASGARERPLFLSISTSGVDREGICYQVRDYSLKVLQGHVDDDSFFSMVYGIDDGDDWRDPAVWQKANPNYGVSVQPDDLARLAKQAEESPSAETNFKTKRLNVWCSTNSAWLSMGAWQACDKPRPPLESWKGQPCYMGLDLASVNDFASVALLFQKDGELYPYVYNYLPMDTIVDKSGAMGAKYREWMEAGYIVATDGSVTDLRYIKEKIIETCEMFNVKQIAFDPYGAHELVSELLDQGLPMVKFPQNIMNMSDPAKEFEKAVLSKRLVHGQDPVVAWMAGNAVIWADVNDNIKVKKDAPANKIDSIIAIIMALGRMKVHAGLAPSPYESRGIRTL